MRDPATLRKRLNRALRGLSDKELLRRATLAAVRAGWPAPTVSAHRRSRPIAAIIDDMTRPATQLAALTRPHPALAKLFRPPPIVTSTGRLVDAFTRPHTELTAAIRRLLSPGTRLAALVSQY